MARISLEPKGLTSCWHSHTSERRVMAYAEAMTATSPEVTDEMVAELRIGLTGQGFKDRCEVPAP